MNHPFADVAGWTTGCAVVLAVTWLVGSGLRASGATSVGAANVVTGVRAGLVAVVTGLVTHALVAGAPAGRRVFVVAAVALALDAADGLVARRTGSATALGARFDGELDAFLMLVLGALLARDVAPWVLGIGVMRYAFLAVGRVLPWFAAPLPPRYGRKVVAAVVGVALVAALPGILPDAAVSTLLAAALGLLTWSFSLDVGWLVRHRPAPVTAVRVGST